MKRQHIQLISLVGLLFLSACQSGYLFENSLAVDPTGWESTDFAQFDVDVTDDSSAFIIQLYLRHSGQYTWSNLYLFVNTFAPTGASIRDTVECILAAPDGRWYGRGLGGNYTLEIPFKQNVVFPTKGTYRFEIQHGMRSKKLEHVKDIGITIKELKK